VAEADEITGLDIDFGGGELVINTSDTKNYQIESKNAARFQYYVEDGILYIKGLKNDTSFGSNRNTIYLSIPANVSLENTEINLGGGTIEADSLTTGLLTIDLGAGSITVEKMKADTADIKIGAGSVEVEDGQADTADFEVGMGEISWKGLIKNDLSAECSMGSIVLELKDKQENHNYEVNCSMGEVIIGDSTYEGMATEKSVDNNVNSTYAVDCSMGNIAITFQ
jgi:DUF4097 and DUF4098 domain-containing protein YvlB